MVIAIGLASPHPRAVGLAATAGLAILSLICVWNIVSDPLYQRPDWRGAAARLGPAPRPRAIVSDIQSQVPLAPYLSHLSVLPAAGKPVSEVDVIWLQRAYQWGPLGAITPARLAGFRLTQEIRSRSYVVLRYRAPRPVVENPVALNRLYPLAARALTLAQGG
jgi:hypothetical protein